MLRAFNLTKLLLLLSVTAMLMMSCASKSGNREPEAKVKAKVMYNDRIASNNFQYGDMKIQSIDPMWKVGDVFRVGVDTWKVIEIEERPFKHVDYPEEINAVSSDQFEPTVINVYQSGDTLYMKYGEPCEHTTPPLRAVPRAEELQENT